VIRRAPRGAGCGIHRNQQEGARTAGFRFAAPLLVCALAGCYDFPSLSSSFDASVPDLGPPAHCADGVKEPSESDLDCGGECPGCPPGKACTFPRDCAQGVCTNNVCAKASCTDGVANGNESDVDCGGSCPGCAIGKRCNFPFDCVSGDCSAGRCVASPCSDGKRDGSETDVDCGGTCPPCGAGQMCLYPADCASASCTNNVCLPANGCSDGIIDGSETDVDCGGGCTRCAVGKTCKENRDCLSNNCSNGLCCGAGTANCDGSAANGCEAMLASDAKNCGSCGHACAMTQSCSSSACVGNMPHVCMGVPPPTECMLGADMETGDRWVVCLASCANAWVSHSEANGPQFGAHFHALQICQSMGYSTVLSWGCSYECSWCQASAAACNVPGTMFFDHTATDGACGSDQFGPILCGNVMWLCGA
jgi:hypothetical protein